MDRWAYSDVTKVSGKSTNDLKLYKDMLGLEKPIKNLVKYSLVSIFRLLLYLCSRDITTYVVSSENFLNN